MSIEQAESYLEYLWEKRNELHASYMSSGNQDALVVEIAKLDVHMSELEHVIQSKYLDSLYRE